jgi:hypothetical protein
MLHRRRPSPLAPVAPMTGSGTAARCPDAAVTGAPPTVDTWDVDPEAVFLRWLADPQAPDELIPYPAHQVPLPISWLLGMLCASARPLPTFAAERLGYRQPRTIGDAAVDLLLAVSDPSGPRCESYAEARQHLRELDVRAHRYDGI